MRITIVILIAVAFIASCKPTEENNNNEMWSKEKFIQVLVDVQITEAYIRLGFYRNNDSLILPDSIYSATFREIGTSKEEFAKNFEYYAAQPEKMEKIYDIESIEELTEFLKTIEKPEINKFLETEFRYLVEYKDADEWNKLVKVCE